MVYRHRRLPTTCPSVVDGMLLKLTGIRNDCGRVCVREREEEEKIKRENGKVRGWKKANDSRHGLLTPWWNSPVTFHVEQKLPPVLHFNLTTMEVKVVGEGTGRKVKYIAPAKRERLEQQGCWWKFNQDLICHRSRSPAAYRRVPITTYSSQSLNGYRRAVQAPFVLQCLFVIRVVRHPGLERPTTPVRRGGALFQSGRLRARQNWLLLPWAPCSALVNLIDCAVYGSHGFPSTNVSLHVSR